jgi:ribosomal protein S18 acetylase RimI-like enzyme
VKIEGASPSDAESILALQKIAYRSEAALYDDYSIAPLTQTLDQITEEFNDLVFLKATESGRIIGSVRGYLKEGTCYIGRLIVHPDYQGRGIGTRLMNAIEARFAQAERFELFTGSRSVRNIGLYERLGYRQFSTKAVTQDLTFVYLEKRARGRGRGGT